MQRLIPLGLMSMLAVGLLTLTGCFNGSGSGSGTGAGDLSTVDTSKIAITPVTFMGMQDKIKEMKGKVVVVDFWADWCGPCKAAFPHLVELHRKYGTKDFAAVSVNLDEPGGAARTRSNNFLKEKKADFTNLGLAEGESPDDWFSNLKIDAIPTVFVYNKQGELAGRFTGGNEYPKVDALVEKLLKE